MRFSMAMPLFLAAVFGSAVLTAAPWAASGPKRELTTIMVTGNYKSTRLLADMVQNENHQPYILLPDPRTGDSRIFFCPPPPAASIQVPEARLNEFIRTANPRRIVIFGGEQYVPASFERALDGTRPVIRTTGRDWNRIADEVTFILNLSHVDRNYRKLRETMLNDGSIYRPVSRPAPKAQPQQEEPKQEVPQQEEPKQEAAAQAVPAAEELPAPQNGAAPAAAK